MFLCVICVHNTTLLLYYDMSVYNWTFRIIMHLFCTLCNLHYELSLIINEVF